MKQQGLLAGCRVLLTRPTTAASTWREALAAAGAQVIEFPTTVVVPPPSWNSLDQALSQLASYDWLLFTSAAAVRFTCGRLPPSLAPSTIRRPQIAAIGEETARAIKDAGFSVALVPAEHTQEGLLAALRENGALGPDTRVLFPRATGGRDLLPASLLARGIHIDVVPASSTIPRSPLPSPPPFDVSTFASPSALAAFADRLGTAPLLAAPCIVIGATTAARARSLGISPVVAQAPCVDAMIEAIAGSAWRS